MKISTVNVDVGAVFSVANQNKVIHPKYFIA